MVGGRDWQTWVHPKVTKTPYDAKKYQKYDLQSDLLIRGHFDQGMILLLDVRFAKLYTRYQDWNNPHKVLFGEW